MYKTKVFLYKTKIFIHTHVFQRLPSYSAASILESSSCQDEEMSMQVVDGNRAQLRKWGRQACILERGVGMLQTWRGRGWCKEQVKTADINYNNYMEKLIHCLINF